MAPSHTKQTSDFLFGILSLPTPRYPDYDLRSKHAFHFPLTHAPIKTERDPLIFYGGKNLPKNKMLPTPKEQQLFIIWCEFKLFTSQGHTAQAWGTATKIKVAATKPAP